MSTSLSRENCRIVSGGQTGVDRAALDAGMYAGVSHDVLLAAGGANFPDKKPWEGGTKAWYDTVWVLEQPEGQWKAVGRLPSPRGYGASVTTDDGLLCIGGAEATKHTAECVMLMVSEGKLITSKLSPLPQPCANICGVRIGRQVLVAGGITEPGSTKALNSLWSLDLDRPDKGWATLPPCPGPERMLACAAVNGESFCLFSGASLSAGADGKPARTYLKDAWSYSTASGWARLPDLPRPVVAAPTPALTLDNSIHVLGGDDGELVNFEPKDKHPGFPKTSLVFDTNKSTWSTGTALSSSVVTNPTTLWRDACIIVSGEIRPGVRSPLVWQVD